MFDIKTLFSFSQKKYYHSKKEKFSAAFPGMVSRQFHGFMKDNGTSPATIVYSSQDAAKVWYHIRVTRVMQIYGSSDDFLHTAFKEMLSVIPNSQVVSAELDSFKGYPSLTFELQIDSSSKMVGIEVLVENRLYIISTTSTTDSTIQYKTFLESVKL